MLNIFYGRENIDKEKFIYDKIAEKTASTLVIVPDQYTLEGEKQAFRLLHTKGLMNVEIISMSRLGFKLIQELGGGNKTFVDKFGRHMLLTQITRRYANELQVFRNTSGKDSFIELANNFISEMKQYDIKPEDLKDMIDNFSGERLLKGKLEDLYLIYSQYEKKIFGKYTDSEDYINLYRDKIGESKLIKGSQIWVYGFDSFAPKALSVLGELMEHSDDVNIFVTFDKNCRDEDLFRLTDMVMYNLEKEAIEHNCGHRRIKAGQEYIFTDKAKGIQTVETEVFAVGRNTSDNSTGITIVEAANMYTEAESAAAFILHLIRDKGMRFKDMVVICNDQTARASIINRVFFEYGINIFDDRKRSILNSPIAVFILSLITAVSERYRTMDNFKVLKSGFSDISEEDIERLENYSIKYRIKGNMWLKPFVKGQQEYGDDGLAIINSIREKAMTIFGGFERIYIGAGNVREFAEGYYDFLIEKVNLSSKIEALIEKQERENLIELSDETRQIWQLIMNLFDQIVELTGDEKFNGREFALMLSEGLGQMEVGVLPPTADDILMGTMQRTRCGNIKAMIVIGANEGLIPMDIRDEGLFSSEELTHINEGERQICKMDNVKNMEEKLAIYRNLSKPSEHLWVSYSASDADGKETRASEIIDTLRRIFPDLKPCKDVVNGQEPQAIIGGEVNTLRHLTRELQRVQKGEKIHGVWKPVIRWFEENRSDKISLIYKSLGFTNNEADVEKPLIDELYKKGPDEDLSISPSRLEKFSRCPFAHFIAYGLKPEERRVFQAAGREIGDVYHKCLMDISEKLSKEGTWDSVSAEECKSYVSEVVRSETENYREGIFNYGNEEKYKSRRIEEACYHVCWALIEQVRQGKIKESRFEVPFGIGKDIPPIKIEANGEKVYIQGKIDRVDVLADERVKIIDYKTGNESFDAESAKGGYRLQLMLYLKAAKEESKKPAGVFYFLIGDPRVDLTGVEKEKISEKISKEMRKSFKLNGIMVNDDSVIDGIAGEFDGYSEIVPLRNSKEGVKGTSEGVLVSEEEFTKLEADVDKQVTELCRRLVNGKIAIHPKKSGKETPCQFCEYKGICRFDLNFASCNYDVIKK